MLKKLENIMNNLTQTENELKEIENKVYKIDIERLNKAISICKKGFDWTKIYTQKNVTNSCYHSTEYEYYKEKGILLDEKILEDIEYEDGNSYIEERELWYLKNGEFKVFYFIEDYSNWQGDTWEAKRSISKIQEIEEFDFDNIFKNIIDNLECKLEKLGDRTKTQKERLKKLELLKLDS